VRKAAEEDAVVFSVLNLVYSAMMSGMAMAEKPLFIPTKITPIG
jgi:hypothetical protein